MKMMRTRIAFFLMPFALLASACGNTAQQNTVIQINMNESIRRKKSVFRILLKSVMSHWKRPMRLFSMRVVPSLNFQEKVSLEWIRGIINFAFLRQMERLSV